MLLINPVHSFFIISSSPIINIISEYPLQHTFSLWSICKSIHLYPPPQPPPTLFNVWVPSSSYSSTLLTDFLHLCFLHVWRAYFTFLSFLFLSLCYLPSPFSLSLLHSLFILTVCPLVKYWPSKSLFPLSHTVFILHFEKEPQQTLVFFSFSIIYM